MAFSPVPLLSPNISFPHSSSLLQQDTFCGMCILLMDLRILLFVEWGFPKALF